MLSENLKYLMSAFLIIALGCGYGAIIVWDGPIYEKFIATGLFSGAIFVTLGFLWRTAVEQDKNDLQRVNLSNIITDKQLEYKALHMVNCPECGEKCHTTKLPKKGGLKAGPESGV